MSFVPQDADAAAVVLNKRITDAEARIQELEKQLADKTEAGLFSFRFGCVTMKQENSRN